ncbi:SRPBCC family protein [Streptomyces sp. NPDC090052]|uniref:SRPBCC family protein n=1 Tax=unclassified Streptomyces TaxID=2593676 RepID=UPI002E1CCE44|nr:SRPBCC family protein [Streptomyces sp. NBC_01020]WSX45210.1 SRPBCC family protein [Streptomyces sp. NBC_00963]WSX66766.1 SRPBCC family protein [Streptomyces sp. NBC_00932]
MRLADGPHIECQIEIAAAPEQVWGLVSDIATSARHSPELQEVAWLDGVEGPAVGACFSGRNRNEGLGEWHTVSRIAELEEPRTFQWEVVYDHDRRDGDALAIWTYTLEPVAGGSGTRLQHGMRIGAARGPLQDFVEKHPEQEEEIIAGRLALLRNGIEATLAGVKAEAEA